VSVVRGDRVILRPFREDEFEAVLSRDREAARVVDPERLEVRRRRLALSGTRTKWEVLFAIEAEGRLIGEIQARNAEEAMPTGVFELGIELYESVDRGRGLGSEAVRAATSHLFGREDAIRVQASTDIENTAMRRSLEKCGFTFEGVLRGFMPSEEEPRDHAMYGITWSDWMHRKERTR